MKPVLHRLRKRPRNHVLLLLARQGVKPHRITRNADRQVRIVLRMGDGIQQHLPVHHVDVQVLPALNGRFVVEVSVQQPDKVGLRTGSSLPSACGTMEKV